MKKSHFFLRQVINFLIYNYLFSHKKSNLHACKHLLFNFDTRFVGLCDNFIFHNANSSIKVTFKVLEGYLQKNKLKSDTEPSI